MRRASHCRALRRVRSGPRHRSASRDGGGGKRARRERRSRNPGPRRQRGRRRRRNRARRGRDQPGLVRDRRRRLHAHLPRPHAQLLRARLSRARADGRQRHDVRAKWQSRRGTGALGSAGGRSAGRDCGARRSAPALRHDEILRGRGAGRPARRAGLSCHRAPGTGHHRNHGAAGRRPGAEGDLPHAGGRAAQARRPPAREGARRDAALARRRSGHALLPRRHRSHRGRVDESARRAGHRRRPRAIPAGVAHAAPSRLPRLRSLDDATAVVGRRGAGNPRDARGRADFRPRRRLAALPGAAYRGDASGLHRSRAVCRPGLRPRAGRRTALAAPYRRSAPARAASRRTRAPRAGLRPRHLQLCWWSTRTATWSPSPPPSIRYSAPR